jgi:uncharacterized NAD(P)/FAD-binding protein YdhS
MEALARAGSIRGLLRAARDLARNTEASGSDWREVVNAIRELAPEIWRGLDESQRRRFLRHVRPYWDVHRHRLPPSTYQRLAELRQSGRLKVHAGRIVEARPWGDHLRVVWRPRGTEQLAHLRVDWMLNCTGPDYDLRRTQDPLFRSAIRAGLVVPDYCGLGPRTGAHGALIEARQALAVESVQPVCLILDGQPAVAQARVIYVRPATTKNCFLVGLEFISTSMLFTEAVERLLHLSPSPSELS